MAVLDQRRRAALGDGDDRQAAGRRPRGSPGRRCRCCWRRGRRRRWRRRAASSSPSSQPRKVARSPSRSRSSSSSGPPPASSRCRRGSARVGAQEALGQQVDALLAGEAAGVEDLDLAREGVAVGLGRVEAVDVDAALPAADPRRRRRRARAASGRPRGSARGPAAGRRRRRRGATRASASTPPSPLRMPGVGGELGVVAGEQRHAGDRG